MDMRIRLAHSAVFFALAVLAGILLMPPHASAQKPPIKIGFLAPLTGGAAQIGRDMVNGFEMYLDEAGGQSGGGQGGGVGGGRGPDRARHGERLRDVPG